MKVKIFNWMHRYPQIFGKFLNWYELRCYKKPSAVMCANIFSGIWEVRVSVLHRMDARLIV